MSLPKYIINMDELSKAILNPPTDAALDTQNLSELISDFNELIKSLFPKTPLSGSQRSAGLRRYVPALGFDFELLHTFDFDVLLTGISYSQSGWKPSDRWSLLVGNELLFDGLYTKELGQYLHFNSFYHVPAGRVISIIHHNCSGNSKQIWFDINYLKV